MDRRNAINNSKQELTLRRPDDWHLHLRDEIMLKAVLPFTARQFTRAIIMPNLSPPVITPSQAADYRSRILGALPDDFEGTFLPLMTAYLTDEIAVDELVEGYRGGIFTAAKLYPANATTNSSQGVTDILKLKHVFQQMEKIGMPLLIHGEVTDPEVDIFDREEVFIRRKLIPLINMFPDLKIVLEHITTLQAVEFVRSMEGKIGATITAHHLIINRNALFQGGLRPHHYCLPVAKREKHRLALREAATSGDSCFFLGTDSAPHSVGDKEMDCGCAGIFSAFSAIELYAQVFDEEGALDKLEGFASLYGPAFYGLDVNEDFVTLMKEDWTVPERVEIPNGEIIRPFKAGETLGWKLK